jgi:PAS domain S-box-containing protein
MLNASGDAIALVDRNMTFIDVNERMEDAFAQPREKLIGRCAWDCMPAKAAAFRRPKAEQILATGKPATYFDDDGQGRTYSTSAYPLKGTDGKVTGIVVFAKDVTQHKKAEAELSHYREELYSLRRNTYVDLFGAVMVHHLSQPLTVMDIMLSETLEGLKSGEIGKKKTAEVLKACLHETHTAVAAIEKMRGHTRQWMKGQIEQFDPGRPIREVIAVLEPKAAQAKMKIEINGLTSLPVISGYQSAFEQVVLALAENAIEASDGKKPHRLAVNAKKTDDCIELEFSDDCCGIAKEKVGKIFEPFYSVKARRGSKCLGLGLPIVHRILKTMGGDIRVKSAVGKGTTFYVKWPLR